MKVWVATGDSMPSKLLHVDTDTDIDGLCGMLHEAKLFKEPKDIGKLDYNVKSSDGTTIKRNVRIQMLSVTTTIP
jgi:hypothetical protein